MNFKDFLGSDALQQASLGLLTGGNAQQQLALGATGFFNGRKEQKTRNATLEWLKTNAPELGGLMESGAISPGDAVSLAWKARQDAMKPQEPKNPFMSAGGQLYNWQTGEWVTPPGGGADTEYAKRQQAAQQFGLAPDSPGYQSFILTGKMPREDGGDGKGQPDLKVDEAKSVGFLVRANQSNKAINEHSTEGTSLWNKTMGGLGSLGNYGLSDNAQSYEQGKRDFINAILRQESGAVISDQEFANADKQYFPQPGDSKQVLDQKAANRQAAIEGLRIRSGPGANAADQYANPQQSPPGGVVDYNDYFNQ